jgi:hypothetical protein
MRIIDKEGISFGSPDDWTLPLGDVVGFKVGTNDEDGSTLGPLVGAEDTKNNLKSPYLTRTCFCFAFGVGFP